MCAWVNDDVCARALLNVEEVDLLDLSILSNLVNPRGKRRETEGRDPVEQEERITSRKKNTSLFARNAV